MIARRGIAKRRIIASAPIGRKAAVYAAAARPINECTALVVMRRAKTISVCYRAALRLRSALVVQAIFSRRAGAATYAAAAGIV